MPMDIRNFFKPPKGGGGGSGGGGTNKNASGGAGTGTATAKPKADASAKANNNNKRRAAVREEGGNDDDAVRVVETKRRPSPSSSSRSPPSNKKRKITPPQRTHQQRESAKKRERGDDDKDDKDVGRSGSDDEAKVIESPYKNTRSRRADSPPPNKRPANRAPSPSAPAPSPPKPTPAKAKGTAAAATTTKTTAASGRTAPAASTSSTTRDPPLQPQWTCTREMFDNATRDEQVPECLQGYTFVFSGVLEHLTRDESEELVLEYGGRVTKAVSGKTDYLVVGNVLEDGRPYTEGSKYKKATDGKLKNTVMIVRGEEALYGLIRQYSRAKEQKQQQQRGSNNSAKQPTPTTTATTATSASTSTSTSTSAALPAAAATATKAAVASNPYAKKPAVNPYAKKTTPVNPYAKKPSASSLEVPSTTGAGGTPTSGRGGGADPTAANDANDRNNINQLWVDRHRPRTSAEILGNQDAVKKLKAWLGSWEDKFNHPQAAGKAFSNPQGPWKAALLSGPPGIGKTTTATIVAKEEGRDVLEFNASDVRSKKAMSEGMGDITGSRTLEFGTTDKSRTAGGKNTKSSKQSSSTSHSHITKRCIIMDEVDGMGGGDRGGMAELIQMIKRSRVPIVCICNDRQSQKIKSLLPYCMDLRYRRPVKSVIAARAIKIAHEEGLRVEQNAAEAIVESCGNDIRQVINCLQMWAGNNQNRKGAVTYKDLKEREHSINKDAILRVSLFDAARTILEGRKGLANATPKQDLDSFFRRNEAYFVDYNFVGLIVQQNYLKVMQQSFNDAKRTNDQDQVVECLERMHLAAESMSDFSLAESSLRGDQNWSLLPFTGALAVKTGYHAGGEKGSFFPGFPEFTTWLGRNSTKGKKARLLSELQLHTNYHISGGSQELRMSYLPVFRERLLASLEKGTGGVEEAIAMMDDYGLDRDDVFEKLDEFVVDPDPKTPRFDKLDSKKKAAFTRAYNSGAHTSQVLVAEQGGGKTNKRKAAGGGGGGADLSEARDPDVIDDDAVANQDGEDEDQDDEMDAAKIQAMFKKTRKAAGKGKADAPSKKSGGRKKK